MADLRRMAKTWFFGGLIFGRFFLLQFNGLQRVFRGKTPCVKSSGLAWAINHNV